MPNQRRSKFNLLYIRAVGLILAVFVGFFTSLFIAIIQVYQSNTTLYQKLMALQGSDFFLIPTSSISINLPGLSTALWGGTFFSFSIGLAVALLSFGFLVNVPSWLKRPAVWNGTGAFFLGMAIISLCMIGEIRLATYLLFIPCLVALTMNRKRIVRPVTVKQVIFASFLFVVFAGGVLPVVGPETFTAVRDNMLLSNSVGSRLNSFYYEYTLYPAESFKSLAQKSINTYYLNRTTKQPLNGEISERLIAHDYLPVGDVLTADVVVKENGEEMAFMIGGQEILRVDVDTFVDRPAETLQKVSLAADNNKLLRQFVYFSLVFNLIAIPSLFCHYFWQSSLYLLTRWWPNLKRPLPLLIGIFCTLLGIVFFLSFVFPSPSVKDEIELVATLQDKSWRKRVAALRFITANEIEIGQYEYQSMLTSPHVPERYWLARSLGKSKDPATYGDLTALLVDPHPNVVCMGLNSLGQRGGWRAVKDIKEKISASPSWYVQMYGYNALRLLGWHQR